MGLGTTRRGTRQLVSHRHILVNGIVTNIPSYSVKPGDVIEVRGKSRGLDVIVSNVRSKHDHRKHSWIEWNAERMEGKFLAYPEREQIPELINEQLIVELYNK